MCFLKWIDGDMSEILSGLINIEDLSIKKINLQVDLSKLQGIPI